MKSIIRKRGTIARSIFVKCVKLGQNKAYDFEIKTKKNFATAYSPRVGEGAGYKKARRVGGQGGKMFNPYLGWMDAETRARERKFLRRMAFVFVMGTFVLPLLGGMVFLAAIACRLML